jgi:hypothetical protein
MNESKGKLLKLRQFLFGNDLPDLVPTSAMALQLCNNFAPSDPMKLVVVCG